MRVDLLIARVPLRLAVRHASATRTYNNTGFLVLTTADGQRGIGEFLARGYVTGESAREAEGAARSLAPVLLEAALGDPLPWLEEARGRTRGMPGAHTAWCAAELAVLDASARARGVSIAHLFGREATTTGTVAYSAVYPLADAPLLATLLAHFVGSLGVREVKVKGTGRLEEDRSLLRAVRAAHPRGTVFRMDLNGSLAPDSADHYVEAILEEGIRWLEQPFPKEDLESSAALLERHGESLVLAADESVCSVADLDQALSAGAFNAVNVRVGKMGGLGESLRVLDTAQRAGVEVQLGCLVGETSVLSYAGLHFAAMARGLAHHEGCFGGALVGWDVLDPPLAMGKGGEVPYSALPSVGLVPAWDMGGLEAHAHSLQRWVDGDA